MVKAASVLGYYLEYAGHKLSSNRRDQHLERTAVELRYRMYDKVLLHLLPFISAYRINHVLSFGRWTAISAIIPVQRTIKPNEVFSFMRMPFFYGRWFIKKSFHKLYTIIFQ